MECFVVHNYVQRTNKKLKTRKKFWVSKPIVFHKRGVAAHSVARFLNEPPEVLVLAWGLSRSMTEICAQFSLAIYLMILVDMRWSFHRTFAIFSTLFFLFSPAQALFLLQYSRSLKIYIHKSKHIFQVNQLTVGLQSLEGSCSSQPLKTSI